MGLRTAHLEHAMKTRLHSAHPLLGGALVLLGGAQRAAQQQLCVNLNITQISDLCKGLEKVRG